MTLNQIITTLFSITVFEVIKVFLLILLGMYIIFAIIVIRQVGLMTKAVQVNFSWFIKLIAWAHLLLSIIVLLVTWSIL